MEFHCDKNEFAVDSKGKLSLKGKKNLRPNTFYQVVTMADNYKWQQKKPVSTIM
jgi:hypothetical protein